MGRMSDEQLMDYLDGVASPVRSLELAERLASDADLRLTHDALRGARDGLKRAFATPPGPMFADRVVRRIASTRSRTIWVRPLAAAVCAAAVAGAWALLPAAESTGTFAARGSGPSVSTDAIGVEVYLHPESNPIDKRIAADGMPVRENDGFSFVLYNRSGAPTHLMLFGRDALGGIHWFYPSANDAASGRSVLISANPPMRPLPDGVTPGPVPDGPFRIVALFTDQPTDTDAVRQAVASSGTASLRARYPDAVVQVLTLDAATGGGSVQ